MGTIFGRLPWARLLLAALVFAGASSFTPTALAATGDVRAEIPTSSGGTSVAFDGSALYYTDLNGAILARVLPDGGGVSTTPIVGAPGITALTYDATHDVFWGVDTTGLGVYRVTRDGLAFLQFTLVPALDLPGFCDVPLGCSTVVTGLAYDATDDSLWYAPQGTERVYHLTTAGQLIGYFDTDEVVGSLFPECATNGVGGLAASRNALYVTAANCPAAYRFAKSDSASAAKLSSFPTRGRAGDAECDDVTYGVTVIWVRDVAEGRLRAVETDAPCTYGGGVPLAKTVGWMSGGGEAIGESAPGEGQFPVQHAFHLLCTRTTVDGPPNNMVVNWKDGNGNHFSFHLKRLADVECFYDLSGLPDPPKCDPAETDACFNRIRGTGLGWLRGRSPGGEIIAGAAKCDECGQIDFTFVDRGEPNRQDALQLGRDDGEFSITDLRPTGPVGVLAACGCERANYQAHPRGE